MRNRIFTLFLWCLAGLLLLFVTVAEAQNNNATPIANLPRATVAYPTNIVPIVNQPGQTNGTGGIELDDLLASLVGFPGWPSVSVTNAIGSVRTNGTVITSSATALNFVQGSNTVLRVTNNSGIVSVEINAVASSGGGGGSVNTNLQLQSLKVYGMVTNAAAEWFGPNYYIQEASGIFQLIDYPRSIPVFTVESSDGRITLGGAGNLAGVETPAPLTTFSHLVGTGSNIFSGPIRLPTIATNRYLFIDGNSNVVGLASGGGSGGPDLHVYTNGVLASIVTNLNFVPGITGYVSGSTLILGVDSRQLTNLNWGIVASTTNVANVSNFVAAVSNLVGIASSNRVQLVGGSGGITVSQSGAGGIQTWTINDDDAGGGASASGTNFQRGVFTNQVEFISGDLGNATSATITIGQTNAYRWFPATNATLAIAGTWPATYQEIKLTLGLTNGQTSITLPYGNINGQTNVALLSSPSTNELVIVSDGVRQWIKSGNTLATGTGNHVMLSNAPVVTSLTLADVATNSIPYIGGGGVISTASLSGLTLSGGVLTASGSVGAANEVGQVAMTMPGLAYGPANWRNFAFVEDEFVAGGTSSGTIGQLNWTFGTAGSGAGILYMGPTTGWAASQFGSIRLAGGTSGNSGAVISFSQSSGQEFFYPTTNWGFAYRVQLSATNSTDTNRIQLGWVQTPGGATYGANGIFFRYDPAATQWQGVVRVESVETIVNCTSPVLANTWYSLSMETGSYGTNFVFSVNGIPEATNTQAGISYGGSRYPIPFASITHSNGTASANLYIEYFNTWRFIQR